MLIRAQKGLTFDDVLLVPKRSSVSSRQEVNTATHLTAAIPLNIPILSANMDTVTEAAMSRHRGAKPRRRCELLGVISLLSPEYLFR